MQHADPSMQQQETLDMFCSQNFSAAGNILGEHCTLQSVSVNLGSLRSCWAAKQTAMSGQMSGQGGSKEFTSLLFTPRTGGRYFVILCNHHFAAIRS